jgi:hypothetical protein
MEYKKLSEKLLAKLDDIFQLTIKIKLGTSEIAALCGLGASVSTIPKTLFDRLDLGSFMLTKRKLHLADFTMNQVFVIKENIVVQVTDCNALIDLVIVDMPKVPTAPIILGRLFLRIIIALINIHEGNVGFELLSRATLFIFLGRRIRLAVIRLSLERELRWDRNPHSKEDLIIIWVELNNLKQSASCEAIHVK